MEEVFKKTNRNLIITAILFVIILAAVIVAYVFISNTTKENSALRTDLLVANRGDIVSLKRAIRNYETHRETVNDLLVDKNRVFAFITDVERIASDSRLDSSVMSVDLFDVLNSGEIINSQASRAGGTDRSHGNLELVIRVTGDWDSVVAFLLKMETIPQQAYIKAVRISSGFDAASQQSVWSAIFDISAVTN